MHALLYTHPNPTYTCSLIHNHGYSYHSCTTLRPHASHDELVTSHAHILHSTLGSHATAQPTSTYHKQHSSLTHSNRYMHDHQRVHMPHKSLIRSRVALPNKPRRQNNALREQPQNFPREDPVKVDTPPRLTARSHTLHTPYHVSPLSNGPCAVLAIPRVRDLSRCRDPGSTHPESHPGRAGSPGHGDIVQVRAVCNINKLRVCAPLRWLKPQADCERGI